MRARKVRGDHGVYGTSKVLIEPPCGCGKYGYTGRKIAKNAAAIARRDTGEPIYAYRCTRGGHVWHIGHPRGWHTQKRRAS